jgi:hypothetical protein
MRDNNVGEIVSRVIPEIFIAVGQVKIKPRHGRSPRSPTGIERYITDTHALW